MASLPQPEDLQRAIQAWVHDSSPAEDLATLRADLEARPEALVAFGIAPADLDSHLQAQLKLLKQVYPDFQQFCQQTWGDTYRPLNLLWHLWLPLGMQLARQRQQLDRPLVQGILGGQGTGKTTLTQVLQLVLNHLGYQSACLSIDDFYKTFAERQNLRREDARLIWRGPPGTHDVDLALQVLDELRYPVTHRPIEIPRFDKSAWNGAGDRTTPDQVQDVDIVMFEGWFVGVRPVPPEQLESLPNPIQTPEDYEFAKDNNARLKAYLPLWQRLDRLIVLLPEDYRFSKTWRMEAEHRMKAKGRTGMTDKQISQFVEYFWKALHPEVFILPLAHSSEWTDLVIEINAQHVPTRVHAP